MKAKVHSDKAHHVTAFCLLTYLYSLFEHQQIIPCSRTDAIKMEIVKRLRMKKLSLESLVLKRLPPERA
jgi:hypothetical protein